MTATAAAVPARRADFSRPPAAHWSAAYVGDPWDARTHDCWVFARRIWRERFGRDVPAVDFDAASALDCRRALAQRPERANWHEVATPAEGDAVLMGKSARPSHVGVWVGADGGRVLHCLQGHGVVCQDVTALRLMGLRVLGYYRRGAP